MPLDLLNHLFVRLSEKVDSWFEGPLRLAIKHDINIPASDHGPSDFNISYRRSLATYKLAHSGPFFSPDFSVPATPQPPSGVEGVQPIFSTVSDSRALFKDESATLLRSTGPYCPGVRSGRRPLPRFLKLSIFVPIACLKLARIFRYRKRGASMTLRNKFRGFALH